MAKDFSKYNDENPVMAILEKAKQEEAAKNDATAIFQSIPQEKTVSAVQLEVTAPQEAQKPEEIKKIHYFISLQVVIL